MKIPSPGTFFCLVCVLAVDAVLGVLRAASDDGTVKLLKKSVPELAHIQKRDVSAISRCEMPPTELSVPAFQFSFNNETHQSIELKWLGKHSEIVLMLSTTTLFHGIVNMRSALWRSENGGRYYANDSRKIETDVIRPTAGILKSPVNPLWVILIGVPVRMNTKDRLHISMDGGGKWTQVNLPFVLSTITFHPKRERLLLADAVVHVLQSRTVWLSTDFGHTWKKLVSGVKAFYWGTGADQEETIYISQLDPSGTTTHLLRSDNLFKSHTVVMRSIAHFSVLGKFVFASLTNHQTQSRRLFISEKSGNAGTWRLARVPETQPAGMYFILDTSEGVIFLHHDKSGKGMGTIYMSDSQGVYYTLSIKHHVHNGQVSDFYKVKSMRATYITSVGIPGSETAMGVSIRSVITFDRGARWQSMKVKDCTDDDSDGCTLHVHGMLSKRAKLPVVKGPLSVEGAHGLIIAHGNTGVAHRTTDINIFVSVDGGYSWSKALSGPHHYAIGDKGKLVAAVPVVKGSLADTIYYSENGGECWHSSKFSPVKWHFTGLMADPNALGMKMTLWGYTPGDGLWQTVTVDFGHVVERTCQKDDYTSWTTHEIGSKDGCVLGFKETVQIVKKDRWCQHGSYVGKITHTPCPCTDADFECDYGYMWDTDKKSTCVADKQLPENFTRSMLCDFNQKTYTQTNGYVRIPGDKCEGGVAEKMSVHTKLCKGHVHGEPPSNAKQKHRTAITVILVILVLLTIGVLAFVAYQHGIRPFGSRFSRGGYRYSKVPQDEEDDELLLTSRNSPRPGQGEEEI